MLKFPVFLNCGPLLNPPSPYAFVPQLQLTAQFLHNHVLGVLGDDFLHQPSKDLPIWTCRHE